ncbi:hypothetical protein DRW41_22410 [Neobacillus piezotolerans]|uniref:CTP synthase n=1 Tax=Neobacillus piezotolerans TaxID=2259171 RepID=A0A3D8GJP3_9BACI|nr:DUF6241 domain-containing protein [Neobacillus piezotolerans]RDU34638.1 hypothetical protein DRW41_22410 [Neobacillus piezotolerans]
MMKWVGIVLVMATLGAGTYFAYDFNKSNHVEETKSEELADTETATGASVFLFKEVLTKEQIEKKYPLDMSEDSMQNTLHEMTHQKIKADKKWGLTPLTLERIERLLVVVESNQSTYEKEDAYLEMLNDWKIGNFNGIDLDHDTIWTLQDGTVGEAYGIYSPAEEEAFIKENYEVLAKGAE